MFVDIKEKMVVQCFGKSTQNSQVLWLNFEVFSKKDKFSKLKESHNTEPMNQTCHLLCVLWLIRKLEVWAGYQFLQENTLCVTRKDISRDVS